MVARRVTAGRMAKITVKQAVEDALDVLGNESKAALLYHLQDRCDISLDRCSIGEVRVALKEILGEGASIIIRVIDRYYNAA